MARWHINKKGAAKVCRARRNKVCAFATVNNPNLNHFGSKEAALEEISKRESHSQWLQETSVKNTANENQARVLVEMLKSQEIPMEFYFLVLTFLNERCSNGDNKSFTIGNILEAKFKNNDSVEEIASWMSNVSAVYAIESDFPSKFIPSSASSAESVKLRVWSRASKEQQSRNQFPKVFEGSEEDIEMILELLVSGDSSVVAMEDTNF